MKHLFFCTALLALFLLAGCDSTATATQASAPDIPQIVPTATPSPTPTPISKPTPTLTPKPAPTQPPVKQSVQQQAPVQQQPAQQPAPATGVNGNPWGYDFNSGNLIYSPNPNFCTAGYFSCINNFSNGRGYVEGCNDGMYSKSGGISGSCSYHKGNWRPLYSH